MKKLLAIVVIILCFFNKLAVCQDITIVTTAWPPFVFEENKKVSGIATEIVRATLNKAGLQTEILLFPWKRAIIMAENDPNTIIYPLIRNEEREPHFIWAIPMFSVKVSLHKLRNRKDIVINSLEDAKKYKIGVLREAAMHLMLLRKGFADEKQLDPVSSNRQNVQKLFLNRIDLDADSSLVIAYEAKKLGLPVSEIEEVLPLFETEVYMAFNKQTPKKTVERIKTAFEQLKTDGVIAAIVDKSR